MQKHISTISTLALYRRYTRIIEMMRSDPRRFKPNPLGDGFLNRNDRYRELLYVIEPELRTRYGLPPY